MYFAAYDARLGIDSAERCLSNINSRLKVALSDRQSVSAFRVSEVYLASPTQLCTVVVLQGPGLPEHLVHVHSLPGPMTMMAQPLGFFSIP